MKKHVSNSIKIANWLEKHPKIEKVNYVGLNHHSILIQQSQFCLRELDHYLLYL